MSMINCLHDQHWDATCARPKHRRNRWSPERRARQAARILEWAPWRGSTGPKTEAGKMRCAQNAFRHGFRSRSRVHELRRVRYALRLAAENLKGLRLLIQLRNARRVSRIRYKPSYAHLSPVSRARVALQVWRQKRNRHLAGVARKRKADVSALARRAKPDCRSRWRGAIAPA